MAAVTRRLQTPFFELFTITAFHLSSTELKPLRRQPVIKDLGCCCGNHLALYPAVISASNMRPKTLSLTPPQISTDNSDVEARTWSKMLRSPTTALPNSSRFVTVGSYVISSSR
uniref:Uncharacterized protein n=1 Tax=Schistocephalus solidus TaxID=70667 RepID=A0A0X3PT03_SCHSO